MNGNFPLIILCEKYKRFSITYYWYLVYFFGNFQFTIDENGIISDNSLNFKHRYVNVQNY